MTTHPLDDGYRRFRAGAAREQTDFFAALAGNFSPSSLIVTCIDARIDPAMIFDTRPGQCMVLRTMGALVPPAGAAAAEQSIEAAIEFAVIHAHVDDILVLGHSDCRAAAMVSGPSPAHLPAVAAWLKASGRNPASCGGKRQEAEKAMIVQSLRNLAGYPCLATAQRPDRPTMRGAWFDIGSALLYDVAPGIEAGSFRLLPDQIKGETGLDMESGRR